MRIQHNLSAMNSLSNYHGNNNALSNNLEKLSSGYRINSAADDAAGLAISEKMRSQIAGLEKAQDNANDGISLIQTAEGALTEVNSMLTRLKSLATQSANGTYEDGVDRANIQEETDALLSEIDRISQSTNFNGISLLDGSLSGKSQVNHVAVDETKAIKGKYTGGEAFDATGDLSDLTKDDIGKTIDYTVTWLDSQGDEQTTTVSLTFQGQGDGTIADMTNSAAKNYFTDDVGNKYQLESGATLSKANVEAGIKAGLKADEKFAAAFEVDITSDKLVLEAKKEGSAGAVALGSAVKGNFADKAVNDNAVDMGGASDFEVTKDAFDSLQRFNATKQSVVGNSATKNQIDAATFEIDGSKFLLVSADIKDSFIKELDSDVAVIKTTQNVTDTAGLTSNATTTKEIAATIQKNTGRTTKAYDTAPAANSAEADAGIVKDDIVFTDPSDKLKLKGNQLDLQVGDTNKDYQKVSVKIQDMSSQGLGLKGLDLGNQEGAAKAIDTIQNAVNSVSMQRGQLGALQNRLEHTLNNLDATDQNITAAESQIRDVDMAKEMTQYSKNNILSQAAQSMLAQANSQPQGVLSLLG